jgi:hypothetical protein
MLKDLSWECIEGHWAVGTKMYELEELEDVWNFQCRTIPAHPPFFFADVLYWNSPLVFAMTPIPAALNPVFRHLTPEP